MPTFIVTIRETLIHRFVAEAPSAEWIEGVEMQDAMIDIASSGKYFAELMDIVVTAEPTTEYKAEQVDENLSAEDYA